jgi:hypothetical protein
LVEAGPEVPSEKVTLVIQDTMGRQIQSIPVRIGPGMTNLEFTNTKGLKGVYFYSINDGDSKLCTGKMVIY